MLPTEPDRLTAGEQRALDQLPRDRDPGAMLEARTVSALRSEGLLQDRHRPTLALTPGWVAAGIAASLALFAGGMTVGQWLGTRSTVQAIVAVEQANAMEVAALVQQTGSQYAAALAKLNQVPTTADSEWVAQGREVALTALYTVADHMVQVAPNDPLVARILQVVDGGDPSAAGESGPAARQLVWF